MTCARISVLPIPFGKERQASIAYVLPAVETPIQLTRLTHRKIHFFTFLLSSIHTSSKQSTFYVFIYLLNILLQNNLLYFIKFSTSWSQSAVFPSTVFLCIWISLSFSLSKTAAPAFIRLSFTCLPFISEYTPIGS